MDKMGVEGDPHPRRRRAKTREKPRVTRNGDHLRMNATETICPRTGEAFLLEFTHNGREIFQARPGEASRPLDFTRERKVLTMDNASWRKCKNLD